MCFSVLGQRVFSIFLNIVPVIDVNGQSLYAILFANVCFIEEHHKEIFFS